MVGQEHITKTLTSAVNSGRISHAYLFTGPRGVGKTSVARILAHEVNQLDYQPDSLKLDIIEIDAASNRRIDEIRDLRDKVHIAPTSAKYKVYIIDEVHMLTREAFNALLKTLEEPPAHCIFILATTEAHKLPETITSRTQKFNFKPITHKDTVRHLADIAKAEKIKATEGALQLIAEHGGGSFRDSIGLLDQLSGYEGQVTEDLVRQFLGLPSSEIISQLIEAIADSSAAKALDSLEKLWDQGANPVMVAQDLSRRLRENLLNKGSSPDLVQLLKKLVEVPASSNPKDYLEICILEAASRHQADEPAKISKPAEAAMAAPTKSLASPAKKSIFKESTPPVSKPSAGSGGFSPDSWPEVIETAKSRAASLYTALRLASPMFSDSELSLIFEFPFHQKKVAQAKNIEALGKIIEELSGTKIKISCRVDKELFKAAAKNAVPLAEEAEGRPLKSMQAINNIFGQAEVLESKP